MRATTLVLASKSPRRSEILRNAGIDFVVRAADVEEVPRGGERPQDYVRRLARSKADAVAAGPGEVVLGADTVVVCEGKILEKPPDAEEAARMIRMLAGRWHEVMTGICLRGGYRYIVDHAVTDVEFAAMSDAEIAAYVASGEPVDRAGSYAIQGLASKFAVSIRGCYFNVVGLPVSLVYQHLKEAKWI